MNAESLGSRQSRQLTPRGRQKRTRSKERGRSFPALEVSGASGIGCRHVNPRNVLRVLIVTIMLHCENTLRGCAFSLSGTLDHSFCHRFLLHVRPLEPTREMFVRSDLLCEHKVLLAFALAGVPSVRDTTFQNGGTNLGQNYLTAAGKIMFEQSSELLRRRELWMFVLWCGVVVVRFVICFLRCLLSSFLLFSARQLFSLRLSLPLLSSASLICLVLTIFLYLRFRVLIPEKNG